MAEGYGGWWGGLGGSFCGGGEAWGPTTVGGKVKRNHCSSVLPQLASSKELTIARGGHNALCHL